MTAINKIVLHIPHASINGIFGPYGKWPRNPHFINECVNRWTDWYTDMLFATTNEKVTSAIFPYSCFYVMRNDSTTTPWKPKDREFYTNASVAMTGECS